METSKKIVLPISVSNLVIPDWLIKPRPDQEINLHKMAVPCLFNYEGGIEHHIQRMAEIEAEFSEKGFYYP